MEDPTPHDQDDSRSMSEKSGSEQGLTKQSSNGSTTQKSGQIHDSTPTTSRGEQPTGAPTMPPPPRPNFKATPTSAQPSSHSQQDSSQELPVASSEKKHGSGRQRTTSSRDSGHEATKPVTRKRSHEEIDRRQAAEDVDDQDDDEGHDEEATDEFKEPANAIAPFDWENLAERYHDQVQDYQKQEQDLYRQFGELSRYFYVWADSGIHHETDRSFKRMRTQVTLVKHHEDELESKRKHYIRVVEAFKMVARILNDDEHADPVTPAADKRRRVAKRPVSHAAIVDAYDWDDVHPSRCVIL